MARAVERVIGFRAELAGAANSSTLDIPPSSDKVFIPLLTRGGLRSRGHSEMGSRDHGMVEFGVQIPMAPFAVAEIANLTRNRRILISDIVL